MPVKKDKGTITTPKSKDKGDSRLKGGANKNTSVSKTTDKPNTHKKGSNKPRVMGVEDTNRLEDKKRRNIVKHTDKERLRIAHAILSVYATGKYTMESCCESQGISDRTFRDWLGKYSELAELYEEYKVSMLEINKQELRKLAEKSLEKLVKGGEYEESVTVVTMDKGKPVVKEVRKTKKIVQPNTAAVLFTLTNLDPKQWRNTQLIEGKLNINAQVKAVEGLTDEQLQAEIDRLSKNPPHIPEI